MNTVIQHIEYLTRIHDCVVVPGLGAFIAQYQGATISDDGDLLLPPSRMLVFNGALTHNDGLIVSSVMRKEMVHYDEAVLIVKQSVSSLKCQLDLDGEVSLATVGFLRKKTGEDAVEFIPGNDVLSINPEFMNLVSLPIKPLVQNESVIAEETKRYNATAVALSPVRNILRIAASVVVLIALSLCLTTPISVKDVSLASMSGASAATVRDYQQQLPDTNDGKISLVRLPHDYGTERVDTASHNAYRRSLSDNFFVIVASLPDEATAAEYLSAKQDENLRILKSDRRYRIYAASASTKQEAISIASSETFLMKYPNAWVYRKR